MNDCANSLNSNFSNNVAHSYQAGLIGHQDSLKGSNYCATLTKFTAHHNSRIGVHSMFNFKDLYASELILIDNRQSISLGLARGDTPDGKIVIERSLISGEHPGSLDCTLSQ